MKNKKIGFKPPEDVLYESDDKMYTDYHLKVIGMGNNTGHLTVTYKGKIIHQLSVPLAYGAIFGADVMDIESWGHIACQVVDAHRETHERD